ncbi:hypothetical protein ICN19_03410 [Polynucleobacter sp. AP-Capit-er-40B-B4]|uniref:hypothetical protein n=1 Tax=Polynucleobacter sp. AP-Capit-er-40B-B4 TaxID=2576927 RepID=UPI001C0AFAF2|nr:hypothetical protein [Polynucleobacter sp. AP-Capit-er-40B-B4]MBU3581063.1 hypothetical protein [Polynucleobacter sp. AP-Capit-er-40B-B4]
MRNRYILDYDNPDAGIGHSMGILNRALKIADRNHLQFAYSETQLAKSHEQSLRWKFKQSLRRLRGRHTNETHNIGNDLNEMLDPKTLLASREDVEQRIRRGEINLIELPAFEIHIPSNEQNDELIYKSVDDFIQSHPEPNIAFKISNNRFGDYEYASTRDWFLNAYSEARKQHPISLTFNPNKLNIAVHIRRGDLLPGRQFSDLSSRMLPDAWYLEILNTIIRNTQKDIAIHIFSEGNDGKYHSERGTPFSWKSYFENTPHVVHEHIDSDFKGTFHHLLNADILIGSKSGMSHLAGMLSKQTKIMPKMWHSYRGANQLLEVSSLQSELNQEEITKHLEQLL